MQISIFITETAPNIPHSKSYSKETHGCHIQYISRINYPFCKFFAFYCGLVAAKFTCFLQGYFTRVYGCLTTHDKAFTNMDKYITD